MLKFIEIQRHAQNYDPAIESCRATFSLREVYINPNHIIMMKESSSLKSLSERKGPLVEGLTEGLSFTEVLVSTPGHMSKTLNVVGSLESIAGDYKKVSM